MLRKSTRRENFHGPISRAINEIGLNTIFIPEAFGGAPSSYPALPRSGQADSRGLCIHRHHLRHELSCDEAADSVRNGRAKGTACFPVSLKAASRRWQSPKRLRAPMPRA